MAFIPVLSNISGMVISASVAANAKYFICKKFEKVLELENDDALKQKGGVYKWVIWTYAALILIIIVSIVFIILSK